MHTAYYQGALHEVPESAVITGNKILTPFAWFHRFYLVLISSYLILLLTSFCNMGVSIHVS